ncbi:MAG TPA: MarR family transcriptional regulator [Stellaceae bacterium]|nr:MarR family transcriptional regulator [Stellaceae bacterium]
MRVTPMNMMIKNGKALEVAGNGQSRPFLEERLSDLLAQADHLMTERLYAQARWRRIGLIEWRVLAVLSHQDGLTMSELAQRVLTKQPTLTKAIDRMERAGLVQRRTPDQDRRRTLVLLTERGRETATPLVADARTQETAVVTEQGEANTRQLKILLRQLIDRLTGAARAEAAQPARTRQRLPERRAQG